LIVFDIVLSGDLSVNVTNEANDNIKLTGNLLIDQFDVKINKSNVGFISPLEINILVAFAKPFLQKRINGYLSTGVIIPSPKDAKIINGQVVLMERALQIDADVKYKNF